MDLEAVKFERSPKQAEAMRLIGDHFFTLLYGGSSSGKTFIEMQIIFTRALATRSWHVVFRKYFNSVTRGVGRETIPDVLSICFPELKEGVHYRFNRSEWFVEFRNKSIVWLAGLDEEQRLDKVLGNRYSTILLNELSEIKYSQVELIKSRLLENSGLTLRLLGDCNPPSKRHWSYKLFFEGINPADKKPLTAAQKAMHAKLLINPSDNSRNIPSEAFMILDSLGKRQRDRFRDGLFASDTEGALWGHDDINDAQLREGEVWIEPDRKLQTIVALDPNVSAGVNADGEFMDDEAGIGVISKDTKSRGPEGRALVEYDYSGAYSTTEWAKKAVWAYKRHAADCIVAERNQGGELVKNALRAEDSNVPVVLVWASKGKYARAEPVTVLYENDRIRHLPGLDKLEDEMVEYVPGKSSSSPNRLDWLVWGLTYLFLEEEAEEEEPICYVL